MGWSGTSLEGAKRRFIMDRLSGEWDDMSALCAAYGISRESGYELMRRYAAEGLGAVVSRSRAPHEQGRAVARAVQLALVDCRLDHPSWGPRKLKAYLERRHPEVAWPAASTIGDVLKRRDLVPCRHRRRKALPGARTTASGPGANETWCVDFKGWFRTGDGQRCDPLTVSDLASRYLLACRICPPRGAEVRAEMDRVFKQFGLPGRLRMDNGPPWGSTGAAGLTPLAVHWLKLGIALEYIEPGAPQQNGRHERMHRTLKAETLRPPAGDPTAQQERFDAFRRGFNEERPHEALGNDTPASHWQPAPRDYPHRVEEPAYAGDGLVVRRVRGSGEIKWKGTLVYLSEALVGEPVALEETDTGDHLVRFTSLPIGRIDRATNQFRRFGPPRPGRPEAEQTQTEPDSVNHVSGP